GRRDVGAVKAYYDCDADLVAGTPIFNLYDKTWPIRTWQHQYPPVKSVFADTNRMGVAQISMVGGVAIISGGLVNRSDLCYDVRTNSYSDVENPILFNHVY